METKELIEKVKGIETNLDTKLKEISEKVDKEKSVSSTEINEVKKLVDEHVKAHGTTKSEIDRLETEMKKLLLDGKSRQVERPETFEDILKKGFESEENKHVIDGIRKGKLTGERIELKEVVDMTFANSTTGKPSIDLRTEIIAPIRRKVHMRDYVGQGATSAQIYQYIQETNTAQEGNAGVQTEGVDKAQISTTIAVVDAKVDTLAATLVISKQMLDDIVGLPSYLSRRLPQEIMMKEDLEILGIGGATFDGITDDAETTPTLGPTLSEPQEWDVLLRAAAYNKSLNYDVTGVHLNPADFGVLTTVKGTNGQYVSDIQWMGGQSFLRGIPLYENSAIPDGSYLLGDFSQVEMIWRQGMSVGFYEQDEDNVKRNKVTVRAEERFALPIYQPKAFIYQTFEDGISALTNGGS